jgi:hypothetical protein
MMISTNGSSQQSYVSLNKTRNIHIISNDTPRKPTASHAQMTWILDLTTTIIYISEAVSEAVSR